MIWDIGLWPFCGLCLVAIGIPGLGIAVRPNESDLWRGLAYAVPLSNAVGIVFGLWYDKLL